MKTLRAFWLRLAGTAHRESGTILQKNWKDIYKCTPTTIFAKG